MPHYIGQVLKHGGARGGKSTEYKIWLGIKKRCFNPEATNYRYYGGRGVTMYAGWVDSFEAFFAWVGPRPSREYSIDRFPESDGNYEPGNVRWATKRQQSNNRTNTLTLTFEGETKTIAEWARATGIHYLTLRQRVVSGWPPEKIFGARYARGNHRGVKAITIDGRTMSITEWATSAGLPRGVINERLARGWPLEDLLKPVDEKQPPLTVDGRTMSIVQWAKETGLSYTTIWNRIEAGWPSEKILTPAHRPKMLKIGEREMLAAEWAKEAGLPRGVIEDRLKRGWPLGDLLKPAGKYAGKR